MAGLGHTLARAAAPVALVLAWLLLAASTAQPGFAGPSLASGIDHACGITPARTVACWGRNLNGQLGTGDRLPRNRATPVPGLTDVSGVAADGFASCAVAGGRLFCWGDPAGPLDAALHGRATTVADQAGVVHPAQIPGVRDAVDVGMTDNEVCVRRATGALRCMQVGDTRGRHRETSVVAVRGLEHVVQLAAGTRHFCARLRGGAVRCWGDRPETDGDETYESRRRAPGVIVPALRGSVSLGLSATSTCGSRRDGTVRCFGKGQRHAKRLRGVRGVRSLTSGDQICAIRAAGVLRCLGYDGRSGDLGARLAPTPPLDGVTAATAREGLTCAQRTGGGVVCWGTHGWAMGSGQDAESDAAVTVPGLTGVTALSAAGDQTCALRADHTVACWGDTELAATPSLTPTTIPGITDAAGVSTSQSAGCSVGLTGAIRCWGTSYAGFYAPANLLRTAAPGAVMSSALGCVDAAGKVECLTPAEARRNVSRVHVYAPGWLQGATAAVTTDDTDVIYCGLFADRTVTCSVFQEGDPGVYADEVRVKVPGFSDVRSVVATSLTVCALRDGGAVACWDGRNGGKGIARPVPALSGASAIALDGGSLCAVVGGGPVRCVSTEAAEQGKADTAAIDIAGITDASAIALGGGHGCALRTSGTVACWGDGSSGQLGDGPMPAGHGPQLVPAPVVGFTAPGVP